MRFFEVVLSGAALIAAAFALELNDVPTSIEAGKSYTITYSPKDSTLTSFILRKGDPNDLTVVTTLTTSATGGSFTWVVPSNLPNAKDYAIEIKQGDVSNYSGLIPLTGGTASISSSYSVSATSTSTKSSSASSTASSTKTESSTLTTTSTLTSASGTISSTVGTNSTVTSATLSRTSSTSATTTGSGPPESTGAAAILGSSPMALIFGAVAAMVYLN